MKAKPVLLLIVALGCGLVAMLGVQQVMSGDKGKSAAPADTIQVMVATQEIAPFATLDDSNTEIKSIPVGAVTDPETLVSGRDEVLEMKLKSGAVPGEYIYRSRLVDKNYSPSSEIPPGMRVVTVKVNATKTHSGLLRPGDRVDVVLTYKAERQGKKPVNRTVTILQYVEVFATDSERQTTLKDAQGNEVKAKNVSLLVNPEHGNLLMLAENQGQLTLSLRTGADKNDAVVQTFDAGIFDNLGGGKVSDKRDARDALRDHLSQNGENSGKNSTGDKKGNEPASDGPTWKLTIYDGSKPRVEEVFAPADHTPRAPTKSSPKKESKPPAEQAAPTQESPASSGPTNLGG